MKTGLYSIFHNYELNRIFSLFPLPTSLFPVPVIRCSLFPNT
ncbi:MULTISPECIES: hypothetical protein [unclassified Moorena]|nr:MULTISPECIES: hypothetical protein [unclassified Moorena]